MRIGCPFGAHRTPIGAHSTAMEKLPGGTLVVGILPSVTIYRSPERTKLIANSVAVSSTRGLSLGPVATRGRLFVRASPAGRSRQDQ